MIDIRIKCKDQDEKSILMDKCHSYLVGDKSYIDSNTILYDSTVNQRTGEVNIFESEFGLMIGCDNKEEISFLINSSDIKFEEE